MIAAGKRPHSPSIDEHECGRNNCKLKFALESESSLSNDEECESDHSIQFALTVSARDSSDTTDGTKDYWSEEYDVNSEVYSDDKLFAMKECDSSGPDSLIHPAIFLAANLFEDEDLWADNSDLDSDSSICTTDSEIPRADYWECMMCKIKCPPMYSRCRKCFQLRKGYFPERPRQTCPRKRRRRRRNGRMQGIASADSSVKASVTEGELCGEGAEQVGDLKSLPNGISSDSGKEQVGELKLVDSGISSCTLRETPSTSQSTVPGENSSQKVLLERDVSISPQDLEKKRRENPELCFMCVEKPRDGGFVHKMTVHVLCCYQCSLKTWNEKKICPVCHLPPQTVARVINA